MLLDQDRRPDTEVMRQLLKDTVYIKAVADPLTGYGKIDKQDKKGDYKMSDKAVLGALNSKRDFIAENPDRNWRVSLEDLDAALALFEAEKMKGKGRPRWPLALAVALPRAPNTAVLSPGGKQAKDLYREELRNAKEREREFDELPPPEEEGGAATPFVSFTVMSC